MRQFAEQRISLIFTLNCWQKNVGQKDENEFFWRHLSDSARPGNGHPLGWCYWSPVEAHAGLKASEAPKPHWLECLANFGEVARYGGQPLSGISTTSPSRSQR